MTETMTWAPTTVLAEPRTPVAAATETPVHDALPAGTRLDEFEIIRVLGAGGFGIVYLALDHVLLRYVAIKEYMPASLAGRGSELTVAVRAPSHAETYAAGLESFFNEARMLASFDHPSLVKVYRFWKALGTSYMAMQYYPGRTLREARADLPGPPDEAWLRACIEPILGALEALHAEDIYHRDIAPDNILLLPDGRPVLLDFGSARQVIGDRTQSITAVLKPNFAPIEQYADEPGMRQGPWTDLYALGATMHFMLTGHAPVPAVLRAVRDTLRVLADPANGPFPGVSPALLATIDWTLALAPEDRPQNVATLRRGLGGDLRAPAPTTRYAPVVRDESEPRLRTQVLPRPLPMPPLAASAAPVAAVTVPMPPAAEPSAPPVAAAQAVAPAQATSPEDGGRHGFSESPAETAPDSPTDRPPHDAGEIALPPAPTTAPARPVKTGAPASRGLAFVCGGIAVVALAVFGFGRFHSAPAAAGAEPAQAAGMIPTALAAAPASIAPSAPVEAPKTSSVADQAPVVVAAESASAASAAAAGGAPPTHHESPKAVPARREARALKQPPPVPASLEPVRPAAPVVTENIAVTAAPKSPKELCGDMNFVALAICVSRQCQSPALQSHPQCVEARRAEDQRRRRMEQ